MDELTRNCLIATLFILIVGGLGIYGAVQYEEELKASCRDIGFKGIEYFNEEQVCEDYDGNLHFVKFDCSGFIFNVKCTAKPISVGGVFEVE